MMIVTFPNLMPALMVAELRSRLEEVSYVDGRRTARGGAANVKKNLEVDIASTEHQALKDKVQRHLRDNADFLTITQAKDIQSILFSRYEPGMAYGDHVDNAIMGRFGPKPMRTDVSFTIFLSDPGEYEGGELVIDSDISPTAFKLPPGHAVIYPTHYLHRVNPVTRGVRQVVVGWVQSLIREPERRQVLLDLQQAMGQLQSTLPGGPNHPAFVRLHKIYINLQRMWSEV